VSQFTYENNASLQGDKDIELPCTSERITDNAIQANFDKI